MRPPAPHWAQSPGPAVRPGSRSELTALSALVVTGVGPVAWTVQAGPGAAWAVSAAALAAGSAGALAARGRRWWGLGVVLIAGAVVVVAIGAPVAAWLAFNALVAWWVAWDDPPVSGLPVAGSDALAPVVILSFVSAALAHTGQDATRIALPVVLAGLMPLITRLGGGSVGRIAARVGDAAATVVSTIAFGVLGAFVVIVPWLVRRPLGLDPLTSATAAEGWSLRRRRDAQATRPWSASADLRGRPLGQRWRPVAFAVVAVVVAVSVSPQGQRAWWELGERGPVNPFRLIGGSGGDLSGANIRDRVPDDVEAFEPGRDGVQAAMLSSPWFYGSNYLNSAQGWALDPRNAWRPVNLYRLLDFRSKLLNIVDSARLSWTPPPCADCTTLTVWIYGGSTTYGLNQRDEYTIASYLARVAAADGVRLEIHNRGSNGQLHWLEAERFAWDLTVDDPPDMVLFYDGVNEKWAGQATNFDGGPTPDAMIDPTLLDVWAASHRSDGPVPDGPEDSRLIGGSPGRNLRIGAMERMVMDRYDQARELSRTTASVHDVPVRYFWQPSRFSRPLVLSEPHQDGPLENRSRLSDQLFQSYLADDVIDLTDSLRSTTEPLFTDDVHHNETGARLVAEAMYASIRTDLRALSDQKEATR